MNTVSQWLNGLEPWWRLWATAVEQGSLYWPGIIAAAATVVICTTAACVVLDASRRTASVPAWGYLQKSVALLSGERDALRRVLGSLGSEREGMRDEVESLRRDKLRLEGV